MKPARHRWLFAISIIVVTVIAGFSWHSSYQARVAEWDEALNNALPLDGPLQSFPTNQLKPILFGGPRAVSYLLDKIEGSLPQRMATRFSQPLPILKRFSYVPDLSTKNSVPIILEKMGAPAAMQIPRMKRIILGDPLNHLNLLNAVAKIGRDEPETISLLITVGLDSKNHAAVRGNCAHYLGMQSPSEEIVEALKKFYSDPDAEVQQYACAALGKHGFKARSATELLVSALENPSPDVRLSAGRSLAEIETNSVGLKLLLSQMTADTNEDVSSVAKRLLKQLEKRPQSTSTGSSN